jgi:AcrR family transcriptional regulator
MFSKFLNLDNEKQNRILNAAIKEFAAKGYKNASTNEMVKEAEISKGLLFHYFKNKKELFLFLYDYCIDLAVNDFYNKINLEERDIIVRLRQISLTKLELRDKYPDIFNFILTAYMEDSREVKEELDKVNAELLKSN